MLEKAALRPPEMQGDWLILTTPGRDTAASIEIRAPRLQEVIVSNSEGAVEANGIDGPLTVDTGADQVKVFDADSFKLLRAIGTAGKKHTLTDPGTFSDPTQVALDGDGNVYVTDMLNNRVEIFDADGQFMSEFGKAGDGPGFFTRPKGIAVDSDGHIWVVDQAENRVQVFDREGRLLSYFGELGPYPGQFSAPYGIAIDKKNRVLVSEQFPGRVQVFQYVTDAEAEAARKKQAEGNQPVSVPGKPVAKDGGAVK